MPSARTGDLIPDLSENEKHWLGGPFSAGWRPIPLSAFPLAGHLPVETAIVQLDDRELLRAYQRDGDERAFAQLVERHGRWITAAARRRLGNEHLADDATQAVFIVLASKAQQLLDLPARSLSAWLFHVMHFTCARLRRSQSRRLELERSIAPLCAQQNSEQAAADSQLLLLIEDSIAQLPGALREMIVRRFYQRQRFAQIGAAMGKSEEAVRKSVTRALEQIRRLMLRDGVDVIPDAFLATLDASASTPRRGRGRVTDKKRVHNVLKESIAMAQQSEPSQGGHQMISAEFLVRDVGANLTFFEKLGFPRRFIDKPDASGRIPRASLTAGKMGKIWIRRAPESEIHPSRSINVFFWIDGGPDGLIAFRKKLSDGGVPVTMIIDEHGLPNFNVTTPDGYSIAFFTQYVPPGKPPITLVQ